MGSGALKAFLGAGIIAACAAVAMPAHAIVINDTAGDGTGPNGAVTLGSLFPGVVNILFNGSQECTGSLISATMVLTAQHCIRSTSGGQALLGSPVQFSVQVKSGAGSLLDTVTVSSFHEADATSNLIDGSDIAILELSSAIPGADATPIRLLDAPTASLIGQAVTMVGFGRHGVGSSGMTSNNADGTRRAATNIVDSYGSARGLGCVSQGGSNMINTDFDNGTAGANSLAGSPCNSAATTLVDNPTEGTTAAGDSGGPLLWYDASLDEYLIAGVLSGGLTPFGNPSAYSDISQWTGTDQWQSFIEGLGGVFVNTAATASTAAEPETVALFVLTLFGLAVYRRRAFNR
jgi:secreted trypsin-like serine protease